ncbi:MAG: exopolysaccharide biosynthesis protein, partial [Oxalobacteraceae bacterium]
MLPFGQVRTVEAASPSILRQYLRMVVRWRYVIVGITAVFILFGLIVTLLMTPKYTATASIEISRESSKVTDIQGVEREASLADQEFYQTQYGLLKSRSLSERVAQQLNLVNDTKFFDMFGIGSDKSAFAIVNG